VSNIRSGRRHPTFASGILSGAPILRPRENPVPLRGTASMTANLRSVYSEALVSVPC